MQVLSSATVRVPTPLRFGYVATGVFDETLRVVAIPPLFTSTDSVFPVARRPVTRPQRRISETCIWGGAAFFHFGHWLTETFPYLAHMRDLLLANPEAPILMVLRPGAPMPQWGALHQSFAQRTGLDLNRIRCVTADTLVERLILPPDPFGRANRYVPGMAQSLDSLHFAPRQGNGKSLFLSRRKLSEGHLRTPNIAEIEAEFADRGYEILHPELLSLDEQMERLLGASHIAGENGSALHWSLYSPHIRSVITVGWRLKLQDGICAVRRQKHIQARKPVIGALMGRRQTVPLSVIRKAITAAQS